MNIMRVIGGKAKGRKLKRVPGDSTRPIMDRVKESLFNILGDVSGQRWLDLFAGTGQVGIEALSRGAAEVVFVDKMRPAILTIQENLRQTQLTTGAEVRQMDAFVYLQQPPTRPFDLIYIAPPQYKGIWLEALKMVDARPLAFLNPHGLVVVQIDPKERQPVALSSLHLADERRYGNTLLCFYEIGDSFNLQSLISNH
ncbi:MAG: 16S rRNA (guanine(966)-N(2))-methyltransferase RsmD [Anaerolineae bacterium]|nr:16S rRNA (guanine(966)-N(2))-methyltransferase RsmD [Anaerolineae bacterium]